MHDWADMRIFFALPGFHRYDRGAEVALLSLAAELARQGNDVDVVGSGPDRPNVPYNYWRVPATDREKFERFPKIPLLRDETTYEELTFLPGLLRTYDPARYDLTLTCSFPYTSVALYRRGGARRPKHVFVTQNGDWPAHSDKSEFRLFGCDGLVCTNPDYFERNREQWRCALIPNGLDPTRFKPGPSNRARFGLPEGPPIVLMVSALIETKRVADGVEAIAKLPDAHLVVAGDGPLRSEVDALAERLLPGRYTRLTTTPDAMPDLYRSADIFLHLSKVESFGNVFIEAIACGLPVVGHDTPRLRWIVGDDEYLVDTDKSENTAAAVSRALDEKDAGIREARQRRSQQFAWSAVAERYRTFFDEVVAG